MMIIPGHSEGMLSGYSYYLKYKSLITLIIEGNYLLSDKFEKQQEKMFDFSKAKDVDNIVDNIAWLKGEVLSLLVDIGNNNLGNIIGDWN